MSRRFERLGATTAALAHAHRNVASGGGRGGGAGGIVAGIGADGGGGGGGVGGFNASAAAPPAGPATADRVAERVARARMAHLVAADGHTLGGVPLPRARDELAT